MRAVLPTPPSPSTTSLTVCTMPTLLRLYCRGAPGGPRSRGCRLEVVEGGCGGEGGVRSCGRAGRAGRGAVESTGERASVCACAELDGSERSRAKEADGDRDDEEQMARHTLHSPRRLCAPGSPCSCEALRKPLADSAAFERDDEPLACASSSSTARLAEKHKRDRCTRSSLSTHRRRTRAKRRSLLGRLVLLGLVGLVLLGRLQHKLGRARVDARARALPRLRACVEASQQKFLGG